LARNRAPFASLKALSRERRGAFKGFSSGRLARIKDFRAWKSRRSALGVSGFSSAIPFALLAMSKPLAVIILTKNEEANLPAALASLEGLDAEVFVVDSGSEDRTLEIAREAGCRVAEHPWENYARQRNWALENLPLESAWVLNLDADERLTPELAREIAALVADAPAGVDGYMLRKRTYFLGRWMRRGGHYPAWHLRLFRRGKGRCEDRLYDQHFVLTEPGAQAGRLQGDYIDILASSLTSWTERHNRWATLEAREILAQRRGASDATDSATGQRVRGSLTGNPIQRRRWLRESFYQRFPLFVRPILYFFYRYFLRLGFLDGREGLVFHVLQGFWFRFLVDAKVFEELRREK
jgi:glycosyltransferase involved in cell wall biosynthesis